MSTAGHTRGGLWAGGRTVGLPYYVEHPQQIIDALALWADQGTPTLELEA